MKTSLLTLILVLLVPCSLVLAQDTAEKETTGSPITIKPAATGAKPAEVKKPAGLTPKTVAITVNDIKIMSDDIEKEIDKGIQRQMAQMGPMGANLPAHPW